MRRGHRLNFGVFHLRDVVVRVNNVSDDGIKVAA